MVGLCVCDIFALSLTVVNRERRQMPTQTSSFIDETVTVKGAEVTTQKNSTCRTKYEAGIVLITQLLPGGYNNYIMVGQSTIEHRHRAGSVTWMRDEIQQLEMENRGPKRY